MNIKQKHQLSKVTGDMEKVVNNSSSLSIGYNMLTEQGITETTYLEKVINLFRKDLFNVLCELDFESEEFLILDDVTLTFRDVLKDKKEVYEYSIVDTGGETKHITNRKGQLIGILEWALDYIVGNIEVEEME
ncbi:pathogenicity island protein [Staphylococcus equorum]|uniref:Pathogenicity island protein n=1 Tax=Staphylococcus equorum TaxID=246432 RepID=A0A9X4R0B8_9STAP|nr:MULTISPECIES: pathogenicity island protein [Staphylococcus]MDG0821139.1 pathogenicity island protein [Staphylococcus equorum]MDG0841796.1 pathogenicity island protein [Staphylococcus equorum]MDG0847513.1 pathogenicity island protein [Staphylococcus equorum]MDK9860131.1 pathogenicity island protein [Staphylococcus equorum]MDW3797377.1 pathogenicity island protein [Staphylococcus saprophyticus]